MKIYSLNIKHGGGKRVQKIINHALEIMPDVIVFTEFRNNDNFHAFRSILLENDFRFYSVSSIDKRQNAICVFSRHPFVSSLFPLQLGEEQHRAMLVKFRDLSILSVYFAQRIEKKILFDFIRTNIFELLGEQGLLIGDFNTGNNLLDSQGTSFYCAEEFDDLTEKYLVDSWRTRNKASEFSWYSSKGNGFRIDHALATPSLDTRIDKIYYSHAERENEASDHSAMVVELI